MVVGTLDEDVFMIKMRIERNKGSKKGNMAFDSTKINMFTGEDKR